jgi:hypothetical protein
LLAIFSINIISKRQVEKSKDKVIDIERTLHRPALVQWFSIFFGSRHHSDFKKFSGTPDTSLWHPSVPRNPGWE